MSSDSETIQALAAGLTAARAEIKRLNDHAEIMNGQLQRMIDRWERLTSVSDEAVERAAMAVAAVPSFWLRYDDWSDDHVEGKPHQVCRYKGDGSVEDIEIVGHYATEEEAVNAQRDLINKARARAALEAFVRG